MTLGVTLEEGDRQLMILSLALTSLLRPGFDDALARIAQHLAGEGMYAEFKRLNADMVQPTPYFRQPETKP